MPSTLRQLDDEPHAAPIAPDIVPADWADCVPHPANDATSREKLFAEIREAAQAAAPKVDNTFRATDVNAIPVLDASSRAWIKRAGAGFAIALVGVIVAGVWKHHGDTATQTLASLVPSPGVSTSPAAEPAEPAAPPVQPMDTTQSATPTASGTAAIPLEAAQQIQSLTRDLAAMTAQVEHLKAQIGTLKASQQAAVAPAPPVPRAPAPKPPAHRATLLPPRPIPVASPPRAAPAYTPATQAAATPPPPAATTASPPQPYAPPPQATTQPNGEPIVRPPMPMPLSDRY